MPRIMTVSMKSDKQVELPDQYTDDWWALYYELRKHPFVHKWKAPTYEELIAEQFDPGSDTRPLINEVETEMCAYLAGLYDTKDLVLDEITEERTI